MATTIKINDDTKERLDRIRARLLLQGKKFKQDELIDFIVTLTEMHPLLLNQENYNGPTSAEQNLFFSVTFKGGKTKKSIDEEIYS
ncbi:MAG: hypothetical protein ACXAD7_01675 [Candidatus Kariarchaeaceae archaeon]